jgi:hypothetical protein
MVFILWEGRILIYPKDGKFDFKLWMGGWSLYFRMGGYLFILSTGAARFEQECGQEGVRREASLEAK